MNTNTTEVIPARFRLQQQEQFAVLFERNVISIAQAQASAAAHSNWELAEEMQQRLLAAMEKAIKVIKGEDMWEGQTNEFRKIGQQSAKNGKLLCE